MSIVVDGPMAASFIQVARPVDVKTADGQVIGTFTPRVTSGRLYGEERERALRAAPPDMTDEELARAINDPDVRWYTAAEVEARMREWKCSQ